MKRRKTRAKSKIQLSKRKIRQMLIITAILIVPPFILWGVSSAIRSNRNYFVGKIGSWRITRPLWRRALMHTRIDYLLKTGIRELPPQVLEEFAWNRLIQLYASKKQRIKVSDAELANYIQNLPIFKDETGNFSLQAYRRFLNAIGVPEKEFEETLREDLLLDKLKQKVSAEVTVSEDEVREAWIRSQEKFKLSYYPIKYETFLPQISVDEEEIRDYYSKHKDELVIPKRVWLSFVIIPKDKPVPKPLPKDLSALAKAVGTEVKKIGPISKEEIVPEIGLDEGFYSYAFNLPEGQRSPLFTLSNGNRCLLRVDRIEEKHIARLEEVKEKIVKTLKLTKAKELAKKEAEGLLQRAEELKWQSIQEISAEVPYLPELGKTEVVVKAVKEALKKGDKIAILPKERALYLIKIEKFTPAPKEIPEREKERLRQELLERKQAELYRQFILNFIGTTPIQRQRPT